MSSSRLLIIEVIAARNLIACERKQGSSNPYVTVTLLDIANRPIKNEKHIGTPRMKTLNPRFEQRMTLGYFFLEIFFTSFFHFFFSLLFTFSLLLFHFFFHFFFSLLFSFLFFHFTSFTSFFSLPSFRFLFFASLLSLLLFTSSFRFFFSLHFFFHFFSSFFHFFSFFFQ